MSHEVAPHLFFQLAALVVVILFGAGRATADTLLHAPGVISNDTVSAKYDAASRTFTLTDKVTGKAFVTGGKLDDGGDILREEAVTDPVFGAGRRIVIARTSGGETALEIYPDLPFVLVREAIKNTAAAETDINHVIPASFTLDLGKPANQLTTLGTAGLMAADKNPGSYLFLTAADPVTRRGVVAGWLTNERGAGAVFSAIKDDKVTLRGQIDYGHLHIPPGQSAAIETLAIGVFDDARLGQELFADAMARRHHIKLRPEVNGYCTWYSDKHGGAGDEKSIVELAKFTAKELAPFGFSFVQIDDGWQDGGRYNGPTRGFDRVNPKGHYAHGMKPVADEIRKLGLTAGIWFLPFARNQQDPEYKDRQNWFMYRPDGKHYETPWGASSLDLTNPEVQAHLTQLVKTIHSWGYDYFKMDGLWSGSATEQVYVNDGYVDDHIGNAKPFHDPSKTHVEVFRNGLRLLREAAGPDVFFSGCCASQNMRSLSGSIGLVDSMRIGPDNGQKWRDYHEEINGRMAGSLVTGPVRGTRLYFLNGRVWWNDPDPSYVRASIPLGEAQLLASWVAISGSFNLNSDWIPGLPADRLNIMKRTMPSHGAIARPVDYFDTIMPSIWLVTDTRQTVRRDVLGLFNWESKPQAIGYNAAKAGLDANKTYYAFDFWSNQSLGEFHGEFKFEVPAQSCRVIALRAAEGHPLLLSTSRHVTQGIVDVTGEAWNDGTLSATSQVVANDPYELRIAGLRDGGKQWTAAPVTISDEDKAAGVTVSHKLDADLLRVTIQSPTSRPVKWRITFGSKPLAPG